jgi:hypothetical protein
MEDVRYTKQLLDCRPIGRRRRPGRTLKRQLEGCSGEVGTGHLLDRLRDRKIYIYLRHMHLGCEARNICKLSLRKLKEVVVFIFKSRWESNIETYSWDVIWSNSVHGPVVAFVITVMNIVNFSTGSVTTNEKEHPVPWSPSCPSSHP